MKHQFPLKIADKTFNSRLFLGSGKFKSNEEMYDAIIASETELVTVALRRINPSETNDKMVETILKNKNINILPNTSGARVAKEAIFASELAREALETNWVKLEIHPDPKYLMPDPLETLKATEELVKKGFVVMPYIHADPVICKQLEEAGAAVVMPLGAPIGTNKGLSSIDFLKIIIEQSNVPVIIDAGLGAPSHAAKALEIGADAVLVNTAIATAKNSKTMALAFKKATEAGILAQKNELGKISENANMSSPLTSFLD